MPALMPARSRLVSTLFVPGGPKSVEMSLDAADTSVCATVSPAFVLKAKSTMLPALHGRVERDVILIENTARGPLQGRSRLHVRTLRRHFGGLRLGQQALVLDHEETGGRTHRELGLLGFERLLLQRPRLRRRLVRRAGTPHGDQGILHFQARLLLL